MQDPLESGWLIALAVAVVPAVLSFLGNMIARETRSHPRLRNLSILSDALAKTPSNSDAQAAVSKLTAEYATSISAELLTPKKLNNGNVAMSFVLVVFNAFIFWGLLTWITNAGGWTLFAQIVSAIVAFSLVIVSIAGFSTWYAPPAEKKSERTGPTQGHS